jgi:hypothetical protein
MERYSSAVESKSRKDYLEMTRHWFEGGSEPEVFHDARNIIGAPGFRVRSSASYASAVYSGLFCLLALRNARDWRRDEDIRLQDLQDHHIFPQAYLKRNKITRRVQVNTVANRTLISDQTNGKIKAKAPSAYLGDTAVFPSGASDELLRPHFIDDRTRALLEQAGETATDEEVADLYERFLQAREAAMIEEIRKACGITSAEAEGPVETDEPAADIKAGEALFEGPDDEIEPAPPVQVG